MVSKDAGAGYDDTESEHRKSGSQRRLEPVGAADTRRRWLRPLRSALPKLRRAMARTPRVDVIERDQDILIRAAVPGIPRDRIDIAVSDSVLTIRGTAPTEEQRGRYHRHELLHGGFERMVTLPCEVEADTAAASVRDGLLELVLPKVERVRPQTIAIR